MADAETQTLLRISDADLARFIVDCADVLFQLEEGGLDPDARRELVRASQARLHPLVFTARAEPRTIVIEALRQLSAAPQRLYRAIVLAAVSDLLPGEDEKIVHLLELLSRVESPDGELIARELSQSAAVLALGPELQELAQESLVYLAASGGVLGMLGVAAQLRELGGLRPLAGLAVLRMTASRQPSQLVLAFNDVRDALEDPDLKADVLAAAVVDLIERAGPSTVLQALTKLNPSDHQALCAAAFRAEPPAFKFVDPIDLTTDEENTKVVCSAPGQRYQIDMKQLGVVKNWWVEMRVRPKEELSLPEFPLTRELGRIMNWGEASPTLQ